MEYFFFILFLLSLIFTIIGLIKPSIFQSVLKDKATRENIVLFGLPAVIITFILFGATASPLPPKVKYKIVTKIESIAYKTIEKKDPKTIEGKTKIELSGKNGLIRITYKNKYVNDQLETSKKIKEDVIKRPINEIKLIGSLPKKVKIKEAEGYYLTALSQIKGGNYELALVNLDKAIDTFPGTYQYAIDKKDQVNEAIEAAKAKQAAYEASMRLKREENTFKNSCKSISYKVLERDADTLIGNKVYLRGEVFNIEVSESKSVAQVNVTNKGYGFWTDQVFIEYPGKLNVFKDDVIKFWGTVAGQYSYESVAGYNITVPSVEVKYYSK